MRLLKEIDRPIRNISQTSTQVSNFEKKVERLRALFKRIQVPSKTILLNEGVISNKVFLIEKGCIRARFNNNGKDVTFQFFFENNVVSSVTLPTKVCKCWITTK